jgi:hypothetical protein
MASNENLILRCEFGRHSSAQASVEFNNFDVCRYLCQCKVTLTKNLGKFETRVTTSVELCGYDIARFADSCRNAMTSTTEVSARLYDNDANPVMRIVFGAIDKRGSRLITIGGQLIDGANFDDLKISDNFMDSLSPASSAGVGIVYEGLRVEIEPLMRFIDEIVSTLDLYDIEWSNPDHWGNTN